MKRKLIIISLLICIFFNIIKAISQTVEDKLRFENINDCNWSWKGASQNTFFTIDHVESDSCLKITLDKEHFIKQILKTKKPWGIFISPDSVSDSLKSVPDSVELKRKNSMAFTLQKIVLLPRYKENNELKISIKSKVENVNNISFSVTGIDANENLIRVDSVNLANVSWKENCIKFPLSNEKAISITIVYEGDDSDLQKIWIANPIIYINGEDIGRLDTNSAEYFDNADMNLDPKYIVPLSNDGNKKLLGKIKGIESKKIIGLGECMHGSAAIEDAKHAFTKDAILNHGCKLVLWEYPIDFSLVMELYVLGLTKESYADEIKKDLRGAFADNEKRFEFIQWLRDYNRQTDEKVHLLGMDIPYLPKVYLTEFFYHLLNEQNGHPYLIQIDKEELDKLTKVLTSDELVRSKLDKNTIAALQKIIKTSLYNNKNSRDYNMYLLINSILTDLSPENKKAVIWAHSEHLDKSQTLNSKLFYKTEQHRRLGSYLTEKYREKYCAVSFQVGQGLHNQDTCSMFGNNTVLKLPSPVIGSFEKSALVTEYSYFLYHSDKLNKNIFSKRSVHRGRRNQDQFVLASLEDHFDAYIFIQDNIPSKNLEEFPFFYVNRRMNEKRRLYPNLLN